MKHPLPVDWDWEKKPKKLVKGQDKAGKHKKSIYNMLSEYGENDDDDNGDLVDVYYDSKSRHNQR